MPEGVSHLLCDLGLAFLGVLVCRELIAKLLGKIGRMSWLQRILRPKPQPEETPSPAKAKDTPLIPTVKFDASLVTRKVKADIRKNVKQIEDIPKRHRHRVYDAALATIESGGNMPLLYNVLLKLDGMTKSRAGEITRLLLSKARAITEQDKRTQLGITHAIWLYANAPCMIDPSHPTVADRKQDDAHKAANGKRFEIAKGLKINGEWTLPRSGLQMRFQKRHSWSLRRQHVIHPRLPAWAGGAMQLSLILRSFSCQPRSGA